MTDLSSNKVSTKRGAKKVSGDVLSQQASQANAPLTHAQKEIVAMLDGTWTQADDASPGASSGSSKLSIDVVLAAVGAAGIFGGVALLFFATALGAVVLVLGCLTCTLAFEHALVADHSQTLEEDATANTAAAPKAMDN